MKKLNYFKNFLLFTSFLFFLMGCRNELETINSYKDKDLGKSKNITLEELSYKLGNNFSSKVSVSNRLSTEKNLTDFEVIPEGIVELQNSPTNVSYTMLLKPVNNEENYSFYNLIIENDNGVIKKTIYKYIPDFNWLLKYKNKEVEPYEGNIQLIYTDTTASTSKETDCEEVIYLPCEYGYYHDDAHCVSSGWTIIIVDNCGNSGGYYLDPNLPYHIPINGIGDGGGGGTIVIPIDNASPEFLELYNSFTSNEKNWINQNITFFVDTFDVISEQNNYNYLIINQFMKWMVNFRINNPDVSKGQFQNWFINDAPDGFLSQVSNYDPKTILNYDTLTSPEFKIRKIDQIKYPTFTSLLKVLKTKVEQNPTMLNRLSTLTGLTNAQVLEKLTFGKGPVINIVPNLTGPSGPNYGNFDSMKPNEININANFVLGLETSTLESTKIATAFLLAVTVLHEFIHYGNFLSGYDTQGQEMGNLFEIDSYGVIVTKYNAYQFIITFKNK